MFFKMIFNKFKTIIIKYSVTLYIVNINQNSNIYRTEGIINRKVYIKFRQLYGQR